MMVAAAFWALQWKLLRFAREPDHARAALFLVLISLLAFPFAVFLFALGFTVNQYFMMLAPLMAASGIGGFAMGIDLFSRNSPSK
jgi:uncharacterized membrane protein YwzB